MRSTSIEFSFDPCNIYRDVLRGVGYPADARSVGDGHPSCYILLTRFFLQVAVTVCYLSNCFSTDSILIFMYLHYRRCASSESGVTGQNPNRNADNDADDDEFDGDSYFDPSYSEDTGDDYYLQGQQRKPGQTNYG